MSVELSTTADIAKQSNSLKMLPLDAFIFPLYGSSLIEASAGTGKTYTIVNLYLRLLLGHGCTALGVEQILVVTFTNAATAELKERIRQRLRQAYLDFFAKHSTDPFIQGLIEQSENLEQDCQRLALASKQMDDAAVFTIHGFCQKALTEHAFESGAMYEQSFILDESEWRQLAVEDYWRKHVVTLPTDTLQLFVKQWAEPSKLLSAIFPFINRQVITNQVVTTESCIALVEQYAKYVQQAKAWWLDKQVSDVLFKAKLNGRAKLSKLDFLQKMQDFCTGDLLALDFDKSSWLDFAPEKVAKAAKKGSEDLSHLDFSLFDELHELLQKCQNALKLSFSQQAIDIVRDNLAANKSRLQLLSPDDLLAGLNRALSSDAHSSQLANALRQTYPAALIDEFQDTDPSQFEIFKEIYGGTDESSSNDPTQAPCWIMIGDPKQAIYAFRGADIFTYIGAKKWVNKNRHFTLATNWRSAPKLIEAINQLFAHSAKGFLFEDSIPFFPVSAGQKYTGLTINNDIIPSLHFEHLLSERTLATSTNEAKSKLAGQTAAKICDLLNMANNQVALIEGKSFTAGDCCVLVRDRNEAKLIKKALAHLKVDSVYLVRESVFSTQTAIDLYRFIKALSLPTDERLLKTALLSELFSYSAQQLDDCFNDESQWQALQELMYEWHLTWQKQGLMRAIKQAFSYFNLEQALITQHVDGLRRVTDLRHLVELLQQQSLQLVGEAQLLHWFEACLSEPDENNESQQLRLENDANLVQIVTLHTSKGLEYPLVFIPFGCSFRATKQAIYHNESEQLEVDFLAADPNQYKAEYERLAEDIRLFYVAITRAVYYCYIGVWNPSVGLSKKSSNLVQSALGCLLVANESPTDAEVNGSISDQHIQQAIQQLAVDCEVSYQAFTEVLPVTPFQVLEPNNNTELACLHLNNKVQRHWRLTSYSAISAQQQHIDMPTPGLDEGHSASNQELNGDEYTDNNQITSNEKTPFTFERGANAGSFLHGVLENIDFSQPEQLAQAIIQQSTWFAIDESWHDCLKNWLTDVLDSAFDNTQNQSSSQTLRLNALSPQSIKVEMEFHMPLHQVQVTDFNRVINQYSAHQLRAYQFERLNGLIKGFIDLMFEFDGKYYVADYKSNHLGDQYADYHQGALEQAMTEHDYHLQAILYTLALHRWLKLSLANYDYEQHIGGAYYLFIRGMNSSQPAQGVYFIKPDLALIENLDALFDGRTQDLHIDEQTQNRAEQGQLGLW